MATSKDSGDPLKKVILRKKELEQSLLLELSQEDISALEQFQKFISTNPKNDTEIAFLKEVNDKFKQNFDVNVSDDFSNLSKQQLTSYMNILKTHHLQGLESTKILERWNKLKNSREAMEAFITQLHQDITAKANANTASVELKAKDDNADNTAKVSGANLTTAAQPSSSAPSSAAKVATNPAAPSSAGSVVVDKTDKSPLEVASTPSANPLGQTTTAGAQPQAASAPSSSATASKVNVSSPSTLQPTPPPPTAGAASPTTKSDPVTPTHATSSAATSASSTSLDPATAATKATPVAAKPITPSPSSSSSSSPATSSQATAQPTSATHVQAPQVQAHQVQTPQASGIAGVDATPNVNVMSPSASAVELSSSSSPSIASSSQAQTQSGAKTAASDPNSAGGSNPTPAQAQVQPSAQVSHPSTGHTQSNTAAPDTAPKAASAFGSPTSHPTTSQPPQNPQQGSQDKNNKDQSESFSSVFDNYNRLQQPTPKNPATHQSNPQQLPLFQGATRRKNKNESPAALTPQNVLTLPGEYSVNQWKNTYHALEKKYGISGENESKTSVLLKTNINVVYKDKKIKVSANVEKDPNMFSNLIETFRFSRSSLDKSGPLICNLEGRGFEDPNNVRKFLLAFDEDMKKNTSPDLKKIDELIIPEEMIQKMRDIVDSGHPNAASFKKALEIYEPFKPDPHANRPGFT